ncbi:MAG: hypothetical protein HY830_26605, partial [Actinobacteria bacterium]|nr:hypothetical protein [Actinomycetota bacterium]
MNTLKDLLDAAAPHDVPFVDAATDLSRGRTLLRRRRTRRGVLAGAGAGIAVAATVAAVVVPPGAPGAP